MSKVIYVVEATIRNADQWAPFFSDGAFYASFTKSGARKEIDRLKQFTSNNILEFRYRPYAPTLTTKGGSKQSSDDTSHDDMLTPDEIERLDAITPTNQGFVQAFHNAIQKEINQ
jgi:hypothetical protein